MFPNATSQLHLSLASYQLFLGKSPSLQNSCGLAGSIFLFLQDQVQCLTESHQVHNITKCHIHLVLEEDISEIIPTAFFMQMLK